MTSPGFLSTYQQYKRDTAVVASWLASTAKQHGYNGQLWKSVTAGLSSQKPTGTGRLKGKARQQAKQRQATVSNTKIGDASYPQMEPKYVLAVRDFVPLAEFIASRPDVTTSARESAVEIPSLVGKALERAIHARKAYLLHFGEVKPRQDAQSHEKHAHFVGILETVRDLLLRPQAAAAVPASTFIIDQTEPTAAQDGLRKKAMVQGFNLFSVLQAYEPSEEFLNAADVTSSASAVYEFQAEEEDAEAECAFAFMALLRDFVNLRDEVTNLWKEYSAGKIDLAAAAVGANLAVELARSMEEAISSLLKKQGDAVTLLPRLFVAVCNALDLDPFEKTRPTDDMNFTCYRIGATLLYNVIALLESIRKAAPHTEHLLPRYTGKFGWYDAQTAHLKGHDSQRWAHDKAALLEVIPDIAMLFELKGIPVHDEFARGVRAMFDTGEIPLWLCLAAQNYLDTLHLFGPDIAKPLAEFRHFNNTAADVLSHAMAADHNSAVNKELEDIYQMVKIETDGMDIFTASWSVFSPGGRTESASRPSSFLQHNPLFCGLWMHYIRVLFHKAGVRYMAKPGVALHTVQLYEAVRLHQQEHDSPVVPKWPDLDRLIAMQGTQAFFVGAKPPSSPAAHFKQYCLSRGVSPTNWLPAATRRKGKQGKVRVQMSQGGIRELRFLAPASRWYAARVEKQEGLNAEVVHQVIQTCRWFEKQQDESEDKSNIHGGRESKFGPIEAGAVGMGQAKATGTPARQVLAMPELLHHAAHAVQDEIDDLALNYFELHQAADGLLRRVRDNADRLGLPPEPRASNNIVDVVGFIFAAVAGLVTPVSGDSRNVLCSIAGEMQDFVTERLRTSTIPSLAG